MSLNLPIKYDSGIFFAYELLEKNHTSEFMKRCDEVAERVKEPDKPLISQTYNSRDLTAKTHEWKLYLEQTWKEIDENEKSVHRFPVDSESKECINSFSLFVVELPYFPYDLLLLKVDLNEKILEGKSRNDLLNIFSPLNTFLSRYPGIIRTLDNYQKYRPAYLKFEKIIDKKIMKKYLDQIKRLHDNKQLDTKQRSELFYKIGQKFRLSNFISDDVDGHRLTLTTKMNSFTILGSMDTLGNQSSLSKYEIVFRDKDRQYFWARNTGFNNKIDYDFSTYVHYISVLLYLDYQFIELNKHEVVLSSLVEEYKQVKEKNADEKKIFYDRLNDFDEKLFFIKSDLKQIDFALNNFLADTICSIPNFNLILPQNYAKNELYSKGILDVNYNGTKNNLNQSFKQLSELQKETLVLKEKFEKDIILDNNLTMKKYTGKTTWLTLSMVILSIVITAATIYGAVTK